MGGLTEMELNGCESTIDDYDHDLCVIRVGRLDILDSDEGEFRRQCVIIV